MVVSRARLMKLLVEKPEIPFTEFEEIVTLAIRSTDGLRIAKQEGLDMANRIIHKNINELNAQIDDLKKEMPSGNPARQRYLGKIVELIEIRETLLVQSSEILKQRESLFETTIEGDE